MPTLDDRIYALIVRLTDLTLSEQLDWEASSTNARVFHTTLESGAGVSVGSAIGNYPYEFTLYDVDNNALETVTTLGPDERIGPWDEPIRQLYLAARPSALNIIETLDALLTDVGVDPSTVPPRPADDDDGDPGDPF